MNITKVKFEKLISTGNYSNITIGVEADVAESETAKEVLSNLESYVNAELSFRERREANAREVTYDIERKSMECNDLERKLQRLKRKVEKAKEFLVKHGVNPVDWDDDPFADE